MQQATLPAFLSIMEGCGEYKKGDQMFEMHGGGKCFMRTSTDPNSVVGITNVRHIWGDEAGIYPLYFHQNLQARSSFKECPIIYTTSPYSLNWIYADYIRKRQKDPNCLEHLELIQARSDENPYFPKKEYEQKRATMDPRQFNMIYGGEFHKLEGLVYDIYDQDLHSIEAVPDDAQPYYVSGVDWGYTNPAVILTFGVCRKYGVFLVNEFYATSKTIGEMVEAARRIKRLFDVQRFLCDPSSPANIVEFNKAGLTAIKANNDIRSGIDALYELMSMNMFAVVGDCAPNFTDEVSIYHYPQDNNIKPDQDIKDRLPVKQHDHAMDAARYVGLYLKMTKMNLKRAPTVPGMSATDTRLHASDELLKRQLQEEYDW